MLRSCQNLPTLCCQAFVAEHPGRDSREALPAVTLRLQPPKLMFALRTNECVLMCPPPLHLAPSVNSKAESEASAAPCLVLPRVDAR